MSFRLPLTSLWFGFQALFICAKGVNWVVPCTSLRLVRVPNPRLWLRNRFPAVRSPFLSADSERSPVAAP